MSADAGPLAGVRVLEFAGVGPGPFATMLLSDLGCEVTRIDRPGGDPRLPIDITSRGRASIELDLKRPEAVAVALEAIAHSDVLIEGYRPGVMEKLGLGPDVALERNRRLIYGRITGWGQTGPLARVAGHDINYIALTGALHAMGKAGEPPTPPLNLVGDFGGGALYLAFGIVAALYERDRSGLGQVIDAAIVDGTASMMAIIHSLAASFPHSQDRGVAGLSGAAPQYRCYECADGRYVAVGALEPQFHAALLEALEIPLTVAERPPGATEGWAEESAALAAAFKLRPRAYWQAMLAESDTCTQPVLSIDEAPAHPQMAARNTYIEVDGLVQPAPAPRFSRTPGRVQGPAPRPGEGGLSRLRDWGVQQERL